MAETVYILKGVRHGVPYEREFSTLEEARSWAFHNIEYNLSYPQTITKDGVTVLDTEDFNRFWDNLMNRDEE